MENVPAMDPVAEADAAVYSAILACRNAFSSIVSRTVIYLHETEINSPGNGFSVHGISLLHTILRVYASAEASFISAGSRIMLNDREGAEASIHRYKTEKGIKNTVILPGEDVIKKYF